MTASSRRTILSATAGFAATAPLRNAHVRLTPIDLLYSWCHLLPAALLTVWPASWPNICTEHLGSQ